MQRLRRKLPKEPAAIRGIGHDIGLEQHRQDHIHQIQYVMLPYVIQQINSYLFLNKKLLKLLMKVFQFIMDVLGEKIALAIGDQYECQIANEDRSRDLREPPHRFYYVIKIMVKYTLILKHM